MSMENPLSFNSSVATTGYNEAYRRTLSDGVATMTGLVSFSGAIGLRNNFAIGRNACLAYFLTKNSSCLRGVFSAVTI